jgi:hypothetical protein
MNASEGLGRLSNALKWMGIGIVAMAAAVSWWVLSDDDLLSGLAFAVFIGWPGPLLILAGWIVGGVAKRRE